MQNELDNTDDIEALRRLALEKALLLDQTDELQSNNKLLTAKNSSLEDELSVLLQRIAELTRARRCHQQRPAATTQTRAATTPTAPLRTGH